MNINIPEGVDKYTKHILIKKYSDSTKKDLISETLLDTTVIFRDNDIIYPDGKIILNDELVTLFDYEYNKDESKLAVIYGMSEDEDEDFNTMQWTTEGQD